jgi:hypothetical protein
MTNKQMFKKKSINDEADESKSATSPLLTGDAKTVEQPGQKTGVKKMKKTAPTPRTDTLIDVGNDTTRLSCDLPRRLHTSLRVAAALSERSMLGLIEALIVKHLLDKPSDQIIAEYHKSIAE